MVASSVDVPVVGFADEGVDADGGPDADLQHRRLGDQLVPAVRGLLGVEDGLNDRPLPADRLNGRAVALSLSTKSLVFHSFPAPYPGAPIPDQAGRRRLGTVPT